MAHAQGDIGTTNYQVAILAGDHALTADEGPALGGQDAGPSPYQILCAALCACTSITLRMYAVRKGWPLEALHVDVQFTADDNGGAMARSLRLTGPLDEAQRARLADVVERTPVTLTLKHGLPIVTTIEAAAPRAEHGGRSSRPPG
jgi:putative redox protein